MMLRAFFPSLWREARLVWLRWLLRDMGHTHPNGAEVILEIAELERAA
jgi:hypothetical protein